jgi:hypothetical protein
VEVQQRRKLKHPVVRQSQQQGVLQSQQQVVLRNQQQLLH